MYSILYYVQIHQRKFDLHGRQMYDARCHTYQNHILCHSTDYLF